MKRRSLSVKERLRLFALHGSACHICRRPIDGARDRWEIDHVIPYALTRDESDENMRPACYACHRERTAKEHVPQIAKAVRIAARHAGATRPKRPMKSRGFGKAEPQRNASRPLDKWRAWE